MRLLARKVYRRGGVWETDSSHTDNNTTQGTRVLLISSFQLIPEQVTVDGWGKALQSDVCGKDTVTFVLYGLLFVH
jgi:hypothetical protein